MSASLVLGLTIANRVTVSPSCVVGTTKASWRRAAGRDHAWYCCGVQPTRRNTTTERSGSRSSSTYWRWAISAAAKRVTSSVRSIAAV